MTKSEFPEILIDERNQSVNIFIPLLARMKIQTINSAAFTAHTGEYINEKVEWKK